jgi:glutamate--cysteine ligase
MSNLQQALSTLAPARLQGIRRGIEKESLRAAPDGALAMTPHPAALGPPSRIRTSPPTTASPSSS